MAVTPLTSLPGNLGFLVQIAFNKGIYNQINDDIREWEQILTMKVADPLARTSRYAVQVGMGPAATQMRNPGTVGRTFPRPQVNTTQEVEFALKEWNTTIALPLAIVTRAMYAKDKKYLEPIAYETTSKAMSNKRVMTADWYADGTGVRGEVGSTTLVAQYGGTSVSDPATLTLQLSTSDTARGFAGWFEYEDLIFIVSNVGTVRRAFATTGTFSTTDAAATSVPPSASPFHVLRVKEKDFALNRVTFEIMSMNSTTAQLTGVFSTASSDTISVTSLATTDKLYRYDQPTFPNLSGSVSDYGTISECTPGLETLAAYDGRTLDGIIRSGILAGTHTDCGGAAIDFPYFEQGLSDAKRRVGEGKYKYKKACMSAETHAALIISREADRRFMQYTDNKRGTTYWAYSHRSDIVEAYVSEFARQNRIWVLPENVKQEAGKVFEFHGTDFMPVKYPGSPEWHLNPSSSGGYTNDIAQFIQGLGRFVCKHSAGVLQIHNFTN